MVMTNPTTTDLQLLATEAAQKIYEMLDVPKVQRPQVNSIASIIVEVFSAPLDAEYVSGLKAALEIVKNKWAMVSVGKVKIENQAQYERLHIADAIRALLSTESRLPAQPERCLACGHDGEYRGQDGSCWALVQACSDDYHGTRHCGCRCLFVPAQPPEAQSKPGG